VSGDRERHFDLAFLFEASRRLNRALMLDDLLAEIRALCLEAVDGEAVNVLIWDEDRSRLEFQLAFNRADEDARRYSIAPNEGLAGWIAANDCPVIVNDLQRDPRYLHDIDRAFGFEGKSVIGIPIHRGRGVIGVVEVLNKRSGESFAESDQTTLVALADPIAVALENALLYRNVQRRKTESEILFQIGMKLNQTLDLDETLNRILDLVGEVLPHDAAGICLLSGDPPTIELISMRGYPPGTEETFRLRIGEGAIGWVVKSGEPLRIPDVARDRRYVVLRPMTRSELVVPMVNEGKVIGAFNLENDRTDAYRPRDVRILTSLANQAAISVQRARLHREVLSRQRLQDEVELARRIQESFLPREDPHLPGYEISGRTVPSLEVGGDLFDFIRITDDHLGVLVADVAGKGIPAALILATFQAAIRSEVRNQYELKRVLSNVNRLLCESTRPEQFVTAFYGVLDLSRRIFTYANAGHNPPMLIRAGGKHESLSEGGLILGSFPDAQYEQARCLLAPGDMVLLYTDGATESAGEAGTEFGVDRIVGVLNREQDRPAAEIRLAMEQEILRHCGGRASDDITLVVIKVGRAAGGRL
jgi:phosphoserine phosphatase RsbU/P